ncbi:MAG: permease [Candidatus Coatesbacteria bacterium RBG_13_66_14]|uniref:Permease n=1 Tax=Candidatus Coatesbacteria bacterium RBG_13_66_14 TaxID=1817816 RepID=A0A1F5FF07_9BACT|nr:MAG: permease [Candidatus Coatesbacteria bacterium RBG_13_66_14]
MKDRSKFILMLAVFLAFYLMPFASGRVEGAAAEAVAMASEYAREHVLFCLIPAFFIAGAVGAFISSGAVLRYLGAGANRVVAYGVASVSGAILAVCSCTVLPLFAGIYKRGAGIGPATTFLYSGPAINVMAIILTAAVLGPTLGIARAVGAVVFSVVIGLAMSAIFRRSEEKRAAEALAAPDDAPHRRRPWQDGLYFLTMVALLVFVNWGDTGGGGLGRWLHEHRFWVGGGFLLLLVVILWRWFRRDELKEWGAETWGFAKQILPLLFAGVLVAGFLLGRPGHEGLIPSGWIEGAVGGNSLLANFFAALAGAFMYFATLTEVPILQGLIGAGMGGGPALALLLAGPALSLPNMLVIRSVLGTKKTVVYVGLVVVLSTLAGWLFGLAYPNP